MFEMSVDQCARTIIRTERAGRVAVLKAAATACLRELHRNALRKLLSAMACNRNPLHTGRHGSHLCLVATPIASSIYGGGLTHTQISNLPQMDLLGCNNWPPPEPDSRTRTGALA